MTEKRRIRVNPWAPPLILLAFAVVLILVQDIPDPLALALAAASALIALVGAIQAVVGGLRPVAASFYIFWFSWLGIGPIAQMTVGKVAWGDSTILANSGRIQTALAMTAVAIGLFWAGDHWARTRLPRHGSPARRASVRPTVQGLLSLVLIAVGLNAIRVLGLSSFFVSRNERSKALAGAGGDLESVGGAAFSLYTVLPSALAIAVTMLAIYRIQLRWRGFRALRALDICHLLLGATGILIFANWLSQTRFIALMAFGAATLAVLRLRSKRAGYLFLTAGLFGTLLIYPLLNVFRAANATAGDITATTFTTNDFDGFQQISNTLAYVDQHGFSLGNHVISAALFFVPRSMWPGKATPASLEIAEAAGYQFTNLSLPVHAELYLQAGWVGVIVGMFALGWAASRFDSAWLDAPLSKMAMMAPVAAMAMFGILRGPMGGAVPAWLPALLMMAIAIKTGSNHAQVEPGALRRGSPASTFAA